MTVSNASESSSPPSLKVNLAGLQLANPIMTASGTCGYAYEYQDFVDLHQLGAFVTKSISVKPRRGNEPTRIVETPGGMMNAIGLANVGLDVFLTEKLPQLEKMRQHNDGQGPRLIVNVAGHCMEDYIQAASRIADQPVVDAVELNVSCPNVADGLTFGTNPAMLRDLVTHVRDAMRRDCRLIVKLSPNVGDITRTAQAAVDGGADILSMVNTFTALAIDIQTRKPRIANGTGGLSGPAIRPLAVYRVSQVYQRVAKPARVPIIGMGGIRCWQDAVEFLIAGATGLAIGTSLFIDPEILCQVMRGLETYMMQQKLDSLEPLIGSLQMPSAPPPPEVTRK